MRIKAVLAAFLCLGLATVAWSSWFAEDEPANSVVRRLLLERQYVDAAQTAERALAADTLNAKEAEELRFFLAHARLLNGDLAGARSAFEVLIERHAQGRFASKARFTLADLERAEGHHAAAMEAWSERARFLVSPERKREVAAIYVRFAEMEAQAEPPRWNLVRGFYDLALELGLPRAEALQYKLAAARAAAKIPESRDAAQRYEALIKEEGDGAEGQLLFGAAEAWLASSELRQARTRYEELVRKHGQGQYAARALLGIAATHGMPTPASDVALERGAEALAAVLREHAASAEAHVAALQLSKAQIFRGRIDDGVASAENFLAQYAAQDEEGAAEARILIGEALASQQRFPAAIAAWKIFLGAHPFHGRWAEVQARVINAELEQARFLLGEEKYDLARAAFEEFLVRYPLDARAPKVHLELGGLEAQRKQWDAALERWQRLVAKYPQDDASSRALFEMGRIQDEQLDQAEKARETWKRCTFGSYAGYANEALQRLEQPYLHLRTPRVFRTDEPVALELATRNIEKLRVRIFPIDLSTYFAAEQDTAGIEELDLEVIEAAATEEWKPAAYRALREIKSELSIPTEGPGCWVIKVDDERLEATCVVLRSDLRMIVRSTKEDLVVMAENARTGELLSDVALRISDGSKPLFEGQCDERGLFYRRAQELREAERLVVFASSSAGSASSGLDLSGLQGVRSLEARTYATTERSAYEPGETVHWRAIVREVQEGRYHFEAGSKYRIEWLNPSGTLVQVAEAALSSFGTLATSIALDAEAPMGTWMVRLAKVGSDATATSVSFDVARVMRPALDLAIEVDAPVLRFGEALKGTVVAKYFHGAPAADRAVRISAWNGAREWRGRTDAAGRLAFEFDSAEAGQEDGVFPLMAVLEDEGVSASQWVQISAATRRLEITTSRDLYLAGESFDLDLKLRDLLGGQVGGVVQVEFFRLVEERGRVVERRERSAEIEVDAQAELTSRAFALVEGGRWRVRARIEDRPGRFVTAEKELFISGEEDQQKLRILHAGETLAGGGEAAIRVLSRLQPARMLVTWTGDGILRYDARELPSGESLLRFPIEADLAPAFALDLCAAEGDALHQTSHRFRVPRDLRVEIEPEQMTAKPGERVRAKIRAYDALGKPVVAEFAVGVVDQAFLAVHPDRAPAIEGFFGGDRNATSQVSSSVLFRSNAQSRPVSQALVEDAAHAAEQHERLGRLQDQAGVSFQTGDFGFGVDPAKTGNLYLDLPALNPAAQSAQVLAITGWAAGGGLQTGAGEHPVSGLFFDDGTDGDVRLSARFANDPAQMDKLGTLSAGRRGLESGIAAPAPRVDFRATAWFAPRVVTNAAGEAAFEFTWPDTTSRWVWTARGVTVGTEVGSAEVRTTTRLELEAGIDLPAGLVVGDSVEVEARLLNASDAAHAAVLEASSRGAAEGRQSVEVSTLASGAEARVVLPLRATRAGEARVRVRGADGDTSDTLERTLRVEADTAELVAVESGIARETQRIVLELPDREGLEVLGLELSVAGVDLEDLVEFALQSGAVLQRRGCAPVDLLSDALARGQSALAVLRSAQGSASLSSESVRRLRAAIADTLARVVSSQRADGGFDWIGAARGGQSELAISTRAHAFLASASKLGFAAAAGALPRSRAYLVKQLASQASTTDQALAMAALAMEGEAEFARLNRLLREQATLPNLALAALAEACFEQGRPELALEALQTAMQRLKRDRRGAYLPESAAAGANAVASGTVVEATARLLSVVAGLDRDRALADELTQFIEAVRAASGVSGDAAKAASIRALARVRVTSVADGSLRVVVRHLDRELLNNEGPLPPGGLRVFVPATAVAQRHIELDLEVRGTSTCRYVAILRATVPGVNAASADHASAAKVERAFLASPLRVDGQAIPIGFSTVQPIKDPWRHELTRLVRGESAQVETQFDMAAGVTHLVLEEPLPAGVIFVPGSATGPFIHHVVQPGRVLFFFAPQVQKAVVRYEVQAVFAGEFAARGTRVWSYVDPAQLWHTATQRFTIAPRGSASTERRLTPDELYQLGRHGFEAGNMESALAHLEPYLARFQPREAEGKEASRMVFFAALQLHQHAKVVQVFESLKDRYAELVIGFEDMLRVADAYKELGEYERGTDVLRGVTEASFLREVGVAGALEERGRFLEAVRFLAHLADEYPDCDMVISTAARLPQMVASRAGQAIQDDDGKVLSRRDLLALAAEFAEEHLVRWPDSALADEVAFGLVGARLEREEYARAVELCGLFEQFYPQSRWRDDFLYARGFAHFALGAFDQALAELQRVEVERFPDGVGGEEAASQRDPAIWMVAQIHQARGRLGAALAAYRRVEERFSDATLAIQQLERKELSLPEVTHFAPGEPSKVKVESRNLSALSVRVYKVDLVRLYLLEKSLDAMTRVRLSGVTPTFAREVSLAGETEYALLKTELDLPLNEPGAYLVVATAAAEQAAGMVIVSDLKMDVWMDERAGLVRVSLSDQSGAPLARADVKAVGSEDGKVRSAETDLRGIASLGGLVGRPTLVVRAGNQVAFHRGDAPIGVRKPQRRNSLEPAQQSLEERATEELFKNNLELNDRGRVELEGLLKQRTKGVQVQQTRGKS